MLEKAVRICDASFGAIYRTDGEALRLIAMHNVPPAYAEAARFTPFRPSPRRFFGRMMATKTAVHITDVTAEPALP